MRGGGDLLAVVHSSNRNGGEDWGKKESTVVKLGGPKTTRLGLAKPVEIRQGTRRET